MAFGSEKRKERRGEEEREALVSEAQQARQSGLPVYFCSLPVSTAGGNFGVGGAVITPNLAVSESLALIEAQGWRLETAGYVFVHQSSISTSLGSMGTTGVTGVVHGQYTFRPV